MNATTSPTHTSNGFSVSAFQDDENARIVALFRGTLLVTLLMTLLILALLLLSASPMSFNFLAFAGLAIVIEISGLVLVKQNRVRSLAPIILVCIAGFSAALPLAIPVSPEFMLVLQVLLAFMAGLFLQRRGMVIVVLLGFTIWLFWMGIDLSGNQIGVYLDPISRIDWLIYTSLYLGFVALIHLVARSIDERVWHIHAQYEGLQKTHSKLQATSVSRAYLENILQSMSEMLVVTTPHGIIQSVNQATTSVLGYREAELIGQPISMLFTGQRPGSIGIETLVKRGYTTRSSKTFISKDGRKLPLSMSGSVLRDNDGNITGVVCVAQDLSEIERMRDDLRTAKARYDQALKSSGAGIWEWDLRTDALYIDSHVTAMLGYQLEELPTNSKGIADYMSANEFERMMTLINQYLSDPKGMFESEHQIRHKDGSLRRLLTRGRAYWDENGVPQRMVCTCVDITELNQARQQAMQYAVNNEKMQVFEAVARDISHDIRTPLSIINTSLYLLQQTTDPAKQQEKLQKIERQTMRIEKLTDSLFTMMYLDGDVALQLQTFDLIAFLRQIATDVQRHQPGKTLNWEYALPAEPLNLKADEFELSKAFHCLIDNAMEFTPDGGTVRIGVEDADDGFVQVWIADTGIGISEADQAHIFERLYKVDHARSAGLGGSGLGLPIAERIVMLHGGYIEVDSTLDVGSTFTVTLPVTQHQ